MVFGAAIFVLDEFNDVDQKLIVTVSVLQRLNTQTVELRQKLQSCIEARPIILCNIFFLHILLSFFWGNFFFNLFV